jgi:hypothetical protein
VEEELTCQVVHKDNMVITHLVCGDVVEVYGDPPRQLPRVPQEVEQHAAGQVPASAPSRQSPPCVRGLFSGRARGCAWARRSCM